jgi:hypothetical protein
VANYGSWLFGGGGFYDQPIKEEAPEANGSVFFFSFLVVVIVSLVSV